MKIKIARDCYKNGVADEDKHSSTTLTMRNIPIGEKPFSKKARSKSTRMSIQ